MKNIKELMVIVRVSKKTRDRNSSKKTFNLQQ